MNYNYFMNQCNFQENFLIWNYVIIRSTNKIMKFEIAYATKIPSFTIPSISTSTIINILLI